MPELFDGLTGAQVFDPMNVAASDWLESQEPLAYEFLKVRTDYAKGLIDFDGVMEWVREN